MEENIVCISVADSTPFSNHMTCIFRSGLFWTSPTKEKNEIKINVWRGSVRTSAFLYKMLTHRPNDLPGCLQHTKACAHMYADDTTIYASSLSTDLFG